MPRRWTLVLRDHADAARPVRAVDCHGLLNSWWPQSGAEHGAAKKWAMNGWPQPLADRLWVWSLTWLADTPPPTEPADLIGRVQRVGDHLLEPLSVTDVHTRDYTAILTGPRRATHTATLHTVSPVVSLARNYEGEDSFQAWPGPRLLFGVVHRTANGILGGSGAVGAVARFAPREIAEPWLRRIDEVTARLRRTPDDAAPIRATEHPGPAGRTVPGWEGGLRLTLPRGSDVQRVADFGALLELIELTGVGKYTAQGFGALRVDTLTSGHDAAAGRRRPSTRERRRPRPPRPAYAEHQEQGFDGLLFD
ncbi:MAG: CRISPR system precrRNA processing endoribonuclease RAMP protein Cas6 [Nocardiopsaceae bacterium]|nr:CRISPR system precrRNA processing endoribonuclease RAMP protein Cas6 [Nocardiopsaceae bacterium]